MRSRTSLSLIIAALLAPPLAIAQQTLSPADPATDPSTDTKADPQPVASSDPRHAEGADDHRHLKKLETVVVTATPLRDTAAELSKPTEVLAGERLDENRAATLGETISIIPGVQSSNFGAGVGRPILRGLDGPRVGVLSGGLSTQDVSTVSQDHSPAIEPFLADQIEVLKGPATLLYGSGAIGGVVNIVDGRIPEYPVVGGFSGRAEARFYGGAQDGITDLVRVDGGGENFALHADAVYRNARDYDTPNGRQANSFIDARSGAVGGSLVGDWGFAGVSASRFEDDYGNPGEPGDLANGERGVFLQLRQDRYEFKGGLLDPFGAGSGLRASFGHTDYEHIEFEGEEVGTTFTKTADEGRVEASYDFGSGWEGAAGVQGSNSTFAAVGEESFVPRTSTQAVGVFGVARKSWDVLQLDFGARVDHVESDSDTFAKRDFTPVSASFAAGYRINDALRLTASFDHAERAPAEEELFADGPHLATLAFEIGDPDLGKEAANQFEVGMQHESQWVDIKLAAYYNRFSDFIYLVDTGDDFLFEEEDETLPIRQWSQRDATFRGFEGEALFHLADNESGVWDLRAFGDTVRARLADDGGNVPRIVPSRFGAQLRFSREGWRAALGATRVAQQDDVAANETPTAGYTLVDAHVAYHFDTGLTGWELFLDASNLTDADARVHNSFIKDSVLLPGRSFSAGVRVFF